MIIIENEYILLGFDSDSGSLVRLYSKDARTEFVSPETGCNSPFRIWSDFSRSYRFADYCKPCDPGQFADTELFPRSASFESCGESMKIAYELSDSLIVLVTVTLDGIRSVWQFSLTNTSECEVTVLPAFPRIDGIALPDDGRMLGVNQAGAVDKIWSYPGGIYGNAMDQSAQLGCMYSGDVCLGFYIEDRNFVGKDVRYDKPSVEYRYFPEKRLSPGEVLALPGAVIMAYTGSWKQTVRAYGDWFRSEFALPEIPRWLTGNINYGGMWFEKHGKPNSQNMNLGAALDSFTEMRHHFIGKGSVMIEYAFHCSLSAAEKPLNSVNCCGSIRRHTDGVNEVRADLGGARKLREGIRLVHEDGNRVMLYIEGLIVPQESELFTRIPKASQWQYMNPDGSNDGPYTYDGYRHMCCGCADWQDHLASTAARLIRETDADGVRLDSFSFYHWPCYNPAHRHDSPFDSNRWMQQLFAKVSAAVHEVKPDAVLATEAAIDFNRLYMNMALDQYFDTPRVEYGAEDCTVFRVLFPEFYIPKINGGPVFHSLQLLPDGMLSECWRRARLWMGDLFSFGTVPDDSPSSDRPDMYCSALVSDTQALIIGARPDYEKLKQGVSSAVLLKEDLHNTSVRFALPFVPSDISLYDIQTHLQCTPSHTLSGTELTFKTDSNWFCVKITKSMT